MSLNNERSTVQSDTDALEEEEEEESTTTPSTSTKIAKQHSEDSSYIPEDQTEDESNFDNS